MSKEAQQALDKMAENARELGLDYGPARLPFGVGGGLVAIKTLLSRDPCVHANTAIQMIDAILAEQPAQRTWVGLTDEEIDETHETKVWDARRSYARAIEAKLKEKNTHEDRN